MWVHDQSERLAGARQLSTTALDHKRVHPPAFQVTVAIGSSTRLRLRPTEQQLFSSGDDTIGGSEQSIKVRIIQAKGLYVLPLGRRLTFPLAHSLGVIS